MMGLSILRHRIWGLFQSRQPGDGLDHQHRVGLPSSFTTRQPASREQGRITVFKKIVSTVSGIMLNTASAVGKPAKVRSRVRKAPQTAKPLAQVHAGSQGRAASSGGAGTKPWAVPKP